MSRSAWASGRSLLTDEFNGHPLVLREAPQWAVEVDVRYVHAGTILE